MTMEHRKHVAGKQVLKTVCPCPVDNVAILLSGGMARTGFQGRKVGESGDIWRRMPPRSQPCGSHSSMRSSLFVVLENFKDSKS